MRRVSYVQLINTVRIRTRIVGQSALRLCGRMWSSRPTHRRTDALPPLCKGRWHGAAVTEGLSPPVHQKMEITMMIAMITGSTQVM